MHRDVILAERLEIERHVAAGARDIADHRERIERLHRAGRDITLAEAVFRRCEQAQDLNVAALARLRSRLTPAKRLDE